MKYFAQIAATACALTSVMMAALNATSQSAIGWVIAAMLFCLLAHANAKDLT